MNRETMMPIYLRADEVRYLRGSRCLTTWQDHEQEAFGCGHLEALHCTSEEDSEGENQCAICMCKEFKGDDNNDG